jgi:hypothetical protein
MDGVKEMNETKENYEYVCKQIDCIIQNNKDKKSTKVYYPPEKGTE